MAPSPDGDHVYAVTSDFVLALRRAPDGRLARLEGEDVGEYLVAVPGARVVVPGDGADVLVLAAGGAAVASYRRDAESGRLLSVETESTNLGVASALAVSRDGTRVYAASPTEDALVVYTRDVASGDLGFGQRIRQQDVGVDGLLDPAAVAVSPDDRHVYVSGSREDGGERHGTVVLLRRASDDSLAFVEAVDTGPLADGGGLVDLETTPDGGELLGLDGNTLGGVVGGEVAAVLRFVRDPEDGRLSFLERVPLEAPELFAAGAADWLALRPDGRRLYLGWLGFPAIRPTVLSYERDATGALTPLAGLELLESGLLSGGASSPDGRFVYTSGAQGVRVLVPEAEAAGAALAALAGLALSRRARRG